jgi:hypothetical protein
VVSLHFHHQAPLPRAPLPSVPRWPLRRGPSRRARCFWGALAAGPSLPPPECHSLLVASSDSSRTDEPQGATRPLYLDLIGARRDRFEASEQLAFEGNDAHADVEYPRSNTQRDVYSVSVDTIGADPKVGRCNG